LRKNPLIVFPLASVAAITFRHRSRRAARTPDPAFCFIPHSIRPHLSIRQMVSPDGYTLCRSRNRSICFGSSECTANPRSTKHSTSAPRGVAMATATLAGSEADNLVSRSTSCPSPVPLCSIVRRSITFCSESNTQFVCSSFAQSIPTKRRYCWSTFTSLPASP